MKSETFAAKPASLEAACVELLAALKEANATLDDEGCGYSIDMIELAIANAEKTLGGAPLEGQAMEDLAWIIDACEGPVNIEVNDHRANYHSVQKELEDLKLLSDLQGGDVVSGEIQREMMRRDTIVSIQAYPDTPIGSFSVKHYDLAMAAKQMRMIIEQDRGKVEG